MRLVFAGTPEVAVPALDALVASSHDVVAVLTRPDAPAGRGRRLTPSPVAARAEELGIEVLKPAHPRDPEFQARLAELGADACAVVAYGALLPQSALDIPPRGWVNLHFSLLPRWRGAAPVQRAIMAGDDEIGTASFRIVRELDAGDVYLLESRPMPDATAGRCWRPSPSRGRASWCPRWTSSRRGRRRRRNPPRASRWRPRSPSTTPASTSVAAPRSCATR